MWHGWIRSSLVVLWASFSVLAAAQSGKTLRFVVGYPPGGSGDFVTRTVGEAIAAELGVTAVIENRPGAAGNLATEVVVKSNDGVTLLVASNPYINKALYKKLNYDIEKDLIPVTLLGNGPMIIAVNQNLPIHSIADLIAHAKKNPGKLNFASSGNGSTPHLGGILFNSVADVNIVHIPFKGGLRPCNPSSRATLRSSTAPHPWCCRKFGRVGSAPWPSPRKKSRPQFPASWA